MQGPRESKADHLVLNRLAHFGFDGVWSREEPVVEGVAKEAAAEVTILGGAGATPKHGTILGDGSHDLGHGGLREEFNICRG